MTHLIEELDQNDIVNSTFMNGFKAGLPIGLGYLIVSFTFGMTACLSGFTPWEAIIMSMTNVTSAGQFAGMQLITNHADYFELMLTVGIINLRYMLMSAALSQKLSDKMTFVQRLIIAFGITDEVFSVALVEVKEITFSYFMGLFSLPFLGWTLGTVLGTIMDNFMNQQLQNAAAIALYCMFIALVLPPAKHHKDIRFVVLLTILLRIVFSVVPYLNQLSSGYSIILSACIAALVGAFRYSPNPQDPEVLQ